MLRWTAAGAVADPTTLQVRVEAEFAGRIAAGAPQPRGSMTDQEVWRNIRHFAVDRAGPRTPACAAVVLAGLSAERAESLALALGEIASLGVNRLTLHLPAGQAAAVWSSPLGQLATDGVAVIETPSHAAALPPGVGAVVPLHHRAMGALGEIAAELARVMPPSVVFTWPLTDQGGLPPAAPELAEPLSHAISLLSGVQVGIKGLVPCALGGTTTGSGTAHPTASASVWAAKMWKSRNRWYVDFDHQLGDALVFFPDIARFTKLDSCRWCALDGRCDGVVEDWLRLGLAGSLTPIREV